MNFPRKQSKWLSRLIVTVLCFVLLALPVSATQLESAAQTFTYTYPVYRWDSLDSRVIGQMPQGSALKVLDETDDFYEIDCFGMSGYIPKDYVTQVASGIYYVNQITMTTESDVLPYYANKAALELRNAIITLGQAQLGTPYVYGGNTPGSFDCSGFSSYLYITNGIDIHRGASSQMQDGLIISQRDLQIGDLVFFRIGDDDSLASHVGVYVGNGQMIHAGSSGICYADLSIDYWVDSYIGARRMVLTDPNNPMRYMTTDANQLFTGGSVLLSKNGPFTMMQ